MAYSWVGAAHFTHTSDFIKIVPPYLPFHLELVAISGTAEIGLGLATLAGFSRRWACYGLIALLAVGLPANVYMLTSASVGWRWPHWLLVLRIPFQGGLMAWAYGNSRITERVLAFKR
ncbi:MAG: DoxX family protein [bacterium]